MKKTSWIAAALMLASAAFSATQERVFSEWKPDSRNYQVTQSKDGMFRAECLENERQAVGVKGYHMTVAPGQKWTVSFQYRGNVKIMEANVFFGKTAAQLSEEKLKPAEEWQECRTQITIPDGIGRIYFRIFSWGQVGWFEIRDFSVEPVKP